ncbi:glycosyltransferase [Gemmatimonas groenlandica]|uniref:Glycosyltransferase n=1 Tax=Gemmatimonas groenlandica TaxID=2732249 RepID=A0A6M4ISK0_9BACT|nr:glycosyltransferase [Gemmatimonas groenlandica]QJR36436.1 glycosyltransferase [Gemmatimonas groenlandica]
MRPVVWVGPVFEPTGYADEVRGMVAALEADRVPVSLRSSTSDARGFRETLSADHLAALTRCVERPVPGPFIQVQHATIDSFAPSHEESVYSVGRSMFETDGLPGHWVAGANALDELWVTGDFNAQTFRDAGVRVPMHVIPGGIDSQLFHPDGAPYAVPGVRGTVFLSVFEWRLRKGWDVLLRAWAEAFSPDDDVTLVIRAYPIGNVDGRRNADILNERIDHFLAEACGRRRSDVARIVLIGERVPARDLPALYRMADGFVLPTRGEGWGRPFMESMACGVPVIATNWSAHLAFLNADNGYLIDVDGLVPADATEVSVYAGQRWADPSASHLSALFRRVHADRAEARALGARARQDMVTEWPWSRVGAAIGARLKDIGRTVDAMSAPAGRATATEASTAGVIVEGGSGNTRRRHSNASEWLFALQQRGNVPYAWRTDEQGVRPSWSSPAIEAWRHLRRTLPAVAVHVTILDETALVTRPCTPSQGTWVIDTGSVVTDRVPPCLVTSLRDRADIVVVPHDMARAAVLAIGVDPARIVVLPAAVDASQFTPTGAKYGRPATAATRFLVIGGDRPHRALARVVSTYDRAFTASDDVLLHLVLPSRREGDLSAWSARLMSDVSAGRRHPNLPALWVDSSPIAYDEMPSLYRSSDVLLHVGTATGRGRTLREAMACGVPVIATDDDLSRQIVGTDAGWRVPPFADTSAAAGAWHSTLINAMQMATDVSERGKRARAAHARSQTFITVGASRRAMAEALTHWGTLTPRALRADTPSATTSRFALQSPRSLVILAHADWHNGTSPAIARAFAGACSTDDDVTLAICLDPAQGVSAEDATDRLRAAMQLAGGSDAQWPDMLLIEDPLDSDTLHRLRASADIVVAVRDPAAAAAARAAGCAVIDSLLPSAWHAAIAHQYPRELSSRLSA